jgi:hypothetical protein
VSARAKVPQHLELGDVVAWGLGATDLLCVALGVAIAWWIASTLGAPIAIRALAAAPALLGGAALGCVRVSGRDLRTWTVVILRYVLRPRSLRSGAHR